MPRPDRRYSDHWKRPIDTESLTRLPSDTVWKMAERNLQRLTAAWEGGMTELEREYRARWVLAMVRELKSRYLQQTFEWR